MSSPYIDLIETLSKCSIAGEGRRRFRPTKKSIKRLVDAIFGIIADSVFGIVIHRKPAVKRFAIPRFGVFSLRRRKSRRVQIKGVSYSIPAIDHVSFRPSKYLRRRAP